MNLNKRQQLLAILAIAAVGFLVVDKLVLTPLTLSWKARSERITLRATTSPAPPSRERPR